MRPNYTMPLLAENLPTYGAAQNGEAQLHSRDQGKTWKKYAWVATNWIYALSVSGLFVAFVWREDVPKAQKYLNGVSSFSMNAPLALLFFDNFGAALLRMKESLLKIRNAGRERKLPRLGEALYVFSFGAALFLATGTVAAGLEIARESVDEIEFLKSHLFLKIVAKILFIFSVVNTFTTRFVGSTNLINDSLVGLHNFYKKHFRKSVYGPYYKLLAAYDHHSSIKISSLGYVDTVGGTPQEKSLLHATEFLRAREREEESSQKPSCLLQAGKWSGKNLGRAATMLLIITMMPLWLYLTVKGLTRLSKSMAGQAGSVWYAGSSNQLFYMKSGWLFTLTVMNVYKATKELYDNAKTPGKKRLIVGVAVLSSILWGTLAYFSGAGFAVDATDAVRDNFDGFLVEGKKVGPEVDHTAERTYFAIPVLGKLTEALFPVYGVFVAQVNAGVIVNGGAALRYFLANILPFFLKKEDRKDYATKEAKKILQSELDAGNVGELNQVGLKDHIWQSSLYPQDLDAPSTEGSASSASA